MPTVASLLAEQGRTVHPGLRREPAVLSEPRHDPLGSSTRTATGCVHELGLLEVPASGRIHHRHVARRRGLSHRLVRQVPERVREGTGDERAARMGHAGGPSSNPPATSTTASRSTGVPTTFGSDAVSYSTDVLAGYATDFIHTVPAEEPLFLWFGPNAPHNPYTPAPRHETALPNFTAPIYPNVNEADVSDKPAYVRRLVGERQQHQLEEEAGAGAPGRRRGGGPDRHRARGHRPAVDDVHPVHVGQRPLPSFASLERQGVAVGRGGPRPVHRSLRPGHERDHDDRRSTRAEPGRRSDVRGARRRRGTGRRGHVDPAAVGRQRTPGGGRPSRSSTSPRAIRPPTARSARRPTSTSGTRPARKSSTTSSRTRSSCRANMPTRRSPR